MPTVAQRLERAVAGALGVIGLSGRASYKYINL